MDRRERAYALIQDQEAWILKCGGNLDGYRQRYVGGFPNSVDADAVYEADISALNDLYYEYHSQGGKMRFTEKMNEALGDGYFD